MIDDLKHRTLYLLLTGWPNLNTIKHVLHASDEDWKEVLAWLKEENYIKIHTIH